MHVLLLEVLDIGHAGSRHQVEDAKVVAEAAAAHVGTLHVSVDCLVLGQAQRRHLAHPQDELGGAGSTSREEESVQGHHMRQPVVAHALRLVHHGIPDILAVLQRPSEIKKSVRTTKNQSHFDKRSIPAQARESLGHANVCRYGGRQKLSLPRDRESSAADDVARQHSLHMRVRDGERCTRVKDAVLPKLLGQLVHAKVGCQIVQLLQKICEMPQKSQCKRDEKHIP